MPFKVFYAWQSGRPNNLCRNLIRRALDDAAAKLTGEMDVEDVVREITIDQDTQDVAGSPSVAETILAKIRECDAFVADLTFLPAGEETATSPNPNVLIEYGYALHAIGDQRIVGVFNSAFGAPENLPFDLRHKRWPIRYAAGDESESEEALAERKAARDGLSGDLAKAIRAIVTNFAQSEADSRPSVEATTEVVEPQASDELSAQEEEPEVPLQEEGQSANIALNRHAQPARSLLKNAEQYPWDGGMVGLREGDRPDAPSREVRLREGPSLFLRLRPLTAAPRISNVRTMEIARSALRPMAANRASGWSYVRNRHGVATFTTSDKDPCIALTASMLTRSGEIFGVDRSHLQTGGFSEETDLPFIPTGAVEEILIDALANFLNVAQHHIGAPLPLEVAAGLEDVENYKLAVDRKYFAFSNIVGNIFDNTIGHSDTINDYDCDPFDVLLPLFNEIYDRAGYERPNVRTAGRSQR